MKTTIAIFSIILPLSAAAQTALKDLKSDAGAGAPVAVPAAPAFVVGAAAVAPAHGALIVTGEVVAVKDGPNPRFPVSEHNPDWKIATVKVARTLKGAPVATVEVWFPASRDIMWAASPKFKVGDTGVWILSDVAAASGHLTALGPSDYHAAPGQPQAAAAPATDQELMDFQKRTSAALMGLPFIEAYGIGANKASQPALCIYYDRTMALAHAQAEILKVMAPAERAELARYEAQGQVLYFAAGNFKASWGRPD